MDGIVVPPKSVHEEDGGWDAALLRLDRSVDAAGQINFGIAGLDYDDSAVFSARLIGIGANTKKRL